MAAWWRRCTRRGPDRTVYSLFAPPTGTSVPRTGADTRSVGKSVLGLLLGIARQRASSAESRNSGDGCLSGVPETSATPERRAITLEHLLTMSSGLDWHEGGPGRDDGVAVLDGVARHYALSRPIAAPPGRTWNYNSGGTAVLADILTRATQTSLRDFAPEEPLRAPGHQRLGMGGRSAWPTPWPSPGCACVPGTWPRWRAWRWITDGGEGGRRGSFRRTGSRPPGSRGSARAFLISQYGYQWWLGTVASQGRPARLERGLRRWRPAAVPGARPGSGSGDHGRRLW